MAEQQPEFSNYNTMDYAMYRHDIERLEEAENSREVNKRRRNDGWVLLAIVQYTETDTYVHSGEAIYTSNPGFIMGVPRPKFCNHFFEVSNNRPPPSQMIWYHERKEWNCLLCDERTAHNDNAAFDKGLQS